MTGAPTTPLNRESPGADTLLDSVYVKFPTNSVVSGADTVTTPTSLQLAYVNVSGGLMFSTGGEEPTGVTVDTSTATSSVTPGRGYVVSDTLY